MNIRVVPPRFGEDQIDSNAYGDQATYHGYKRIACGTLAVVTPKGFFQTVFGNVGPIRFLHVCDVHADTGCGKGNAKENEHNADQDSFCHQSHV